jgi:hypothetical protein
LVGLSLVLFKTFSKILPFNFSLSFISSIAKVNNTYNQNITQEQRCESNTNENMQGSCVTVTNHGWAIF